MAFTKEQQQAIDMDNTNIIVSAGAGSGKTAVLTERVIRKIKEGIDVNKLLVLTFTNEAANEMKSRIRDKIIENNLDSQLPLLDSAYITTFDSYALSLVKKYNYLLNVSDNLKIIDSGIITIYKEKVLEDILGVMYGNPSFDKLISDFCLKDDYLIKEYILEVSSKLDLLTDKEGYINNYFINICSKEFRDKCINDYIKLIKDKINELSNIYHELTSYISNELDSKINDWLSPLLSGNSYDDYILFTLKDVPRFTKVEEPGLKLKDNLKNLASEIKDLLRFKDTN
ncbi:MAG: UvrD-helicase domain-containing protein, partial [Bacilli bacterium]|nr:UvrD-helicase domain-containing protein [Bacilli bacterium]